MLTGSLPTRHGVRDNIGYTLGPELPTLAELLRAHGYRTGAAVSAFVLRAETGISRGFEHFDDELRWSGFAVMGDVQRPGLESLAALDSWLGDVVDEPFFLFLHLYEPHAPYTPPEPFASRYELAYDGEIAAADEAVGALLAELDRLDLYQRSAIVLTSDHGEGLGEHGEGEHGVLLYRESLQVPLILKLPDSRFAGHRVGAPVQLSDVAPTLLELAGAPLPVAMTGTPLVELIGQRGANSVDLLRDLLPTLPSGLERPALTRRRALSLHRRPDAGALRSRGATRASWTTLLPRERRRGAALRRQLEEHTAAAHRNPTRPTRRPARHSWPWATSGSAQPRRTSPSYPTRGRAFTLSRGSTAGSPVSARETSPQPSPLSSPRCGRTLEW